MKKFIFLAASVLLVISCTSINRHLHKKSGLEQKSINKNIIFLIVDGMGLEHIKATRIFNGQKPLSFENYPCKTLVTTCSFDGADDKGACLKDTTDVTDSAAAATAIATGVKVINGAISQEAKHGEAELKTILEIAQSQGQSTGVIATKLFTDATPAAFISHAAGRKLDEEILRDIFSDTLPTLIFGADNDTHKSAAQNSGLYRTVSNASELKQAAKELSTPCQGSCPRIYGGFGQHVMPGANKKVGLPLEISAAEYAQYDVPHLSQMTSAALEILSQNEKGFFLMVESSMPDMISHFNTQIDEDEKSPKAIEALVKEIMEVEKTAQVIEKFIASHPNTLLVVTADHETGGLVVEEDKTACLGKKGCVPSVKWTSAKYEPTKESASRHTAADVGLYALGQGAKAFCTDKINNIDIARLSLAE